ncbi:DUF1285 domain-containing protein [Microbulbifer thermotolerans]|nr:DUF1285 domain-containing protein [Microbulbifer thermotolerans]MCX2794910.1 DUF1285 domain-containing protein [Microbulbifer thermotolerans]WKT59007.1 DUF1285 domain-containing protein [Microbulbifer thermotolerans]SFB87124.1 hypothetical protein SAMN05660479_00693 [Microbulbifer thermotolerans]
MAESLFETLQRMQREFSGHPPVHKWNPDFCGDMDLVIRRDGRWIHEGVEIRRQPLVKLFASVLKREGDDYFLVTPVEKLRIRVEDVPFIATQVAKGVEAGRECLLFTSNTGDIVPLESGRGWQLKPYGDPPLQIPYIEVRQGLEARISRQVYYQLVDWAEDRAGENCRQLWLHSDGEQFLLGSY